MTEENKKQDQTPIIDPIQNMALDVFVIYQQYWKKQQEAVLQYWTQAVKNAYNPWDIK